MYNYNNLLYAIANCGFITPALAQKYFNISRVSFKQLEKNHVLSKKGNFILFGKTASIYNLTDKSKYSIRSYGKYSYRTNTSQLEHDYLLLKAYCLLPTVCQDSWLNETELKLIYGNITTTDALFIYNNLKISVEVITPAYSNDTIQDKVKFSNNHCDKLITLNTADIKY